MDGWVNGELAEGPYIWKLHSKQTTRSTRKGLALPPRMLLAPFSLALLSNVPTRD